MTIATSTTGTSSAPPSTTAPGVQASNTRAAASLGSNLNDFLKLLMTQLQNQDPTQPLDTNQFTSQLVQFATVEQQINANTNLTTLIQLTQGGQMLQAGSLVGKQVEAQSDALALQKGRATLDLHPAVSGPVMVSISSASGVTLRTTQVQATSAGTNWDWDGTTSAGQGLPDGTYKVAVTDANGTAIPFGVIGTVSGVQKSGSAVLATLSSGLQVPLGSIQATR